MTAGTCVLPHAVEPERPRLARDGGLVCAGDYARLERAIAELPAAYDGLLRVHPGYALSARAPAVSGSRERPLPISERVVEVRAQIEHDLRWWVRRIAHERGLLCPPSDVNAAAGWLAVQLDYAAARPWITDMHPVFLELSGQAHALRFPSGVRRIAVGSCVEEACRGQLQATIRPDATLELPSTIRCDGCGAETPARQWLDLGHRLRGYVTTAQAAELTGVPVKTLHRWGYEGRISPLRDNGRTYWALGELRELVHWRKTVRR